MPDLQAPGQLPNISRAFRADKNHMLKGRKGQSIKKLILHNTETDEPGNAPSADWLSVNKASGVSINHLYGRDGTRYDLVDRADTAFHAGNSAWGDIKGSLGGVALMNLVSIGHELESSATIDQAGDGYTDAQYNSLAYTLATELISYGLTWEDDVLDHAQIAIPAGRRHDPSRFDRALLKRETDAWLAFLQSLPADQLAAWCI